jgi:Pyruvate/2-oxoacid:ferredoxin oxidoreductase delta subunit
MYHFIKRHELNAMKNSFPSSWSKISVFYFSGTGNARQIALWIADLARENQLECAIYDISKLQSKEIEPLSNDTLLFFISPIHGFNFPKITSNFIQKFPKGSNNVVLMNTRAGMKLGRYITPGLTGIAFMISAVKLRLKGYKVIGSIPYDMPSNWISIHPAIGEKSTKFIFSVIQKKVEKHFKSLISGKSLFVSRKDIVQDLLIAPVSLGYYFAGRFIFAKSFYASHKCNNCGLCAHLCPVKAIQMKNKRPFWTLSCESCMKCMNSCPENAIETAHGMFAAISIFSSLGLTLILNNLTPSIPNNGFVRILIFTIVFFLLLWLLYGLQHFLLRYKLFAKLISFSSLTSYKFWGRYKAM